MGKQKVQRLFFLYIAIAFLMIGILGIFSYRKRTIFKQDLLEKVSK